MCDDLTRSPGSMRLLPHFANNLSCTCFHLSRSWRHMLLFSRRTHTEKYRAIMLVGVLSTLLAGCHSSRSPLEPTVDITTVPAANPGGPLQMDLIEGRTRNAKPGQQLVLYAHSGIWWIQ